MFWDDDPPSFIIKDVINDVTIVNIFYGAACLINILIFKKKTAASNRRTLVWVTTQDGWMSKVPWPMGLGFSSCAGLHGPLLVLSCSRQLQLSTDGRAQIRAEPRSARGFRHHIANALLYQEFKTSVGLTK